MTDLNKQQALAPCPFCASEARVECRYGVDFWVQCTNMNCASTNGKTTTCRDFAVTAWNRRAPAAAPAPVAAILTWQARLLTAGFNSAGEAKEAEIADLRAALAAAPAAAPIVQPVAQMRLKSDLSKAWQDIEMARLAEFKAGVWADKYEFRTLYATPASSTAAAKDAECRWTPMNDDSGAWEMSCRSAWWFPDGTPEENGIKFCPCCGKRAAIASSAGEVKL